MRGEDQPPRRQGERREKIVSIYQFTLIIPLRLSSSSNPPLLLSLFLASLAPWRLVLSPSLFPISRPPPGDRRPSGRDRPSGRWSGTSRRSARARPRR